MDSAAGASNSAADAVDAVNLRTHGCHMGNVALMSGCWSAQKVAGTSVRPCGYTGGTRREGTRFCCKHLSTADIMTLDC